MYQNLPNILTLSRIVVIPIIVLLFFFDGNRWLMLIIFSIAGITDFFDGYIARSQKKISKVGIFLDPVADKLLIATVILMLVAYDRITGPAILPALIILFREILVSGLREFLAQVRKKLPVSKIAKWKTAIQMIALGFLIIGDDSPLLNIFSHPSAPFLITSSVLFLNILTIPLNSCLNPPAP